MRDLKMTELSMISSEGCILDGQGDTATEAAVRLARRFYVARARAGRGRPESALRYVLRPPIAQEQIVPQKSGWVAHPET
ncbi:MAG TPA: hypothetical protein VGL13_08060 [Polyangiaceae bacterium]